MFTYTAAEQIHLQDLRFEIAMSDPQADDAEYFRYLATLMPEAPSHGYPHPDDCDGPTATELLEMAEAIECGMQRGEFI